MYVCELNLKMKKMKKVTLLICLFGAISFNSYSQKKKDKSAKDENKIEFKTKMDSISYIIGTKIGQNLKSDTTIKFVPEAIISGLRDAMTKNDSVYFKEAQKKKIIEEFQQEMMMKQHEKTLAASNTNKKKGKEFLEANKKKEGVKVTASGLQYKIIKEGIGVSPKVTDNVKVNYEGSLIDGTIFDSSYKRGEPVTFPLNRVIKGWTEGVQLMKEGATYEFYIPSDLAYGDQDNQSIPGGSTLIFKVELLKVGADSKK